MSNNNNEKQNNESIKQKNSSIKKRPKKNRSPFSIYIMLAGFVIFLAVIVGGSVYMVNKYMPNSKLVPVYTYYDFWDENRLQIINNEEPLSDPAYKAVEADGEIYLSFEFIKKYIDKYIFWDNEESMLIFTTANTVTRFPLPGSLYYENGEAKETNTPFHVIDKNALIPVSFLTDRYNIEIGYGTEYKTIIVEYKDKERIITTVKSKKAVLRYEPDIKSPIEARLAMGDALTVFETSGEFTKVRTSQGLIGYVKTSDLDEAQIIRPIILPEPAITHAKPLSGKITLLWDQVTNVTANSEPLRRQAINGVDVLSPTWFSFDDQKLNGEIISVADKSYVDFAHENGYQVWALITDNFNSDVSNSVVNGSATREYVISQLINYVDQYNLDGINIDFESVKKDDAELFLQFIRELAPSLRQRGAYLSVDMFVPSPWSMYYNRAEVGKAADFICVMTYDEHYSGSPVSGPVASLNFVDSGIADTLEEVPKEKILMGMPFYVRVWREERVSSEDTPKLSIRNYSMEYAYDLFKKNNAEFIWLADIGSFYAEYHASEDGKKITYKVWLEDEYSIEQKLKIVDKYDVAGVACWKRGLEKQNVWALIEKYIE